MKRVAVLGLFLSVLIQVNAQVGNEWINFNQSYFKIPVGQDGIYRLAYADLQASGFPLNGDPRNIQLFHRGVEQAITIEGEGDGQFNTADFLEFFGKRNDGTLDAELYKPSSVQPHRFYNLYNDTTSYFLTVGSTTGKRISTFSEINGALPVETYHTDEKLLVLTNSYSAGNDNGTEIWNTFFDQGEGWTGTLINLNQSVDYTLTGIINGATTAGAPQLELMLVGRRESTHRAEIYVGASLRLLATVDFNGFETHTVNQAIDWADIAGDGKLTVRVKTIGTGGPDRLSVSYIKLKYPQTFNDVNETEKVWILAENSTDKSAIEIQNAPVATRLFDVTDPAHVIAIGTTTSGTLNAVVPLTSTPRRIFATSFTRTPVIKPVTFRSINPADHNYIIISHPQLHKPAGGYADPVKAYAGYRASTTGGGFDTLVVDVPQLFDQFSYGEQTPVAIYRFMKYLAVTNLPEYLFIIGKGLDVHYNYYRKPSTFTTYKDFVPSAGYPAADAYFTVGLAGTTYEPAVPTGRITATTAAGVAAYLEKVKEAEALPFDAIWRKNLLHLSGGIEEGEPEMFRAILENYATIARGYYLGGEVSAIAKRSTDIELINIADEVNKGLNLVTFFGHSSPSTLDFDIGFVTDPVMGYDNRGKYPMMIMNGCNAGAFFLNTILFGEDWILADKKGAVGFIAHTSYGFVPNLNWYSSTFYNVAYADSTFIVKGIGDIQKETARRYMLGVSPTPDNTTQVQQMILLGDPAMRLFGAPKPDYEVNNNNVFLESFTGEPVTALTDSFALKIIVRNFGQANDKILAVEVKRTLNDNSVITYDSLFNSVLYTDTLEFIIRKGRENGFGNNTFTITLDPDSVIQELQKDNNTASLELVIPLNGTKNLFPSNFSIVNTTSVTLSLQTTDLLSDERQFTVELDTLNSFDSPYKKTFTVSGKVLARLPVTLLSNDTLAYYWRTRLTTLLPGESDRWTTSSFTFINNSPSGWAQVHFPQYLENHTDGLVTDAVQRELIFEETVTPILVRTFGGAHASVPADVSVKINNAEYNLTRQGFSCRDNTINLIAFDRRSTVPYIGIPFKWYNRAGRSCGREPWVINSFTSAELITGNNDDITTYVNNIILGDSVMLFNIGYANYSLWPAAAKSKLGELGISVAQLDALQNGDPVVIFGRKGLSPGAAKIYTAQSTPADQQQLDVAGTITGRYTEGSMTSTVIGPARQWQSFIPRVVDVEPQDAVGFIIQGVKLNGEAVALLEGVSGITDLSAINASEFPYLKIDFITQDNVNLTASQLNKWLVLYTPVPEGLLIFNGDREQQQLTEGSVWKGNYGFINISTEAFTDSVSVRYEIFNQTNRSSHLEYFNIKAPAPDDTTIFSLEVGTVEREGLNDVNLFVNPQVLPEQYYDNNVLNQTSYLKVMADHFNPVMEVTIDGRQVVNGDFVSHSPVILVNLWDENRSLLKIDTEGMRVFLTYPCDQEECSPTLIDLNGDEVVWQAATATSDFTITFRPTNLNDGNYTLRVEAADKRGNSSGIVPYEVDFVVQHEAMITVLPPRPNPFAVEVNFPIVITGETVPDDFTLHIMDVNGKLLRTITQSEIDFHIGINQVTWNGANASGDRMPGGLYIYKLVVATGAERVSRNGKVVLVR